MKPFLGRQVFNHNTLMYAFSDGSGPLPVEMHDDIMAECDNVTHVHHGLNVLSKLFDWKDKLGDDNGNS